MSIAVSGNHFVNGSGQTVQLRGVNVSGLEFAYIQHSSMTNPWSSANGNNGAPNWSTIRNTWKANVVRLPLNESSWNGTACTLNSNTGYDPDPGNNYRSFVITQVQNATAAGLYVIVDLHWTAPGAYCANQQNPMGSSKSVLWWTDVANTFKAMPNVIFELFNEPFPEESSFGGPNDGTAAWNGLRDGLTLTKFSQNSPASPDTTLTWNTVGMQALLNAVRGTGATNVVLAGGLDWSQNLSQWLTHKPTDPLDQLAAVWHMYGIKSYEGHNTSDGQKPVIAAIVAAGIPVVTTEFQASNEANVLPWADSTGVSYVAWTYNPSNGAGGSYALISDSSGTPTTSGARVKTHYVCRDAGTVSCE